MAHRWDAVATILQIFKAFQRTNFTPGDKAAHVVTTKEARTGGHLQTSGASGLGLMVSLFVATFALIADPMR